MMSVQNLREQIKELLLQKYGVAGHANSQMEALKFYITDRPGESLRAALYEPSFCVILQGAKAVGFGKNMYGYDENIYLLASTYMPLNVRVTKASKDEPYVSLALKFSLDEIYEVLKNIEIQKQNLQKSEKGVFFGELSDELLEPILRLVWLNDKPKSNIDYIAGLIKKEILFALANDKKSGYFLNKFAMQGSASNKISRAIIKIKDNFNEKINIKDLARACDMSESSLYQNFKTITSLSPIAFQKKIRLEEAKNLLSNTDLPVAQAAFEVGYESASQFSREYSRMFGVAPKVHSAMLKAN